MKFLHLLFFLAFNLLFFSQKNPTQLAGPIIKEGKLLYKSEMASWYGTDLFLEKYNKRENIGGYFSYSEKKISKCVFFSKSDKPLVIGTITFDSTYNVKTAIADLTERKFTKYENDLYCIRKIALQEAQTDTLIVIYQNTNLNFIPLINGKEKKVYILTGTQQNNVVIFGNDYLLTFDKKNNLKEKKQLHKNIIPSKFGSEENEENKTVAGAMHSHVNETGDYITATDICTIMLYEKFTKWKSYNVVSEKYINIWNCETNTLTVLPMGPFNQIIQDEENQKK